MHEVKRVADVDGAYRRRFPNTGLWEGESLHILKCRSCGNEIVDVKGRYREAEEANDPICCPRCQGKSFDYILVEEEDWRIVAMVDVGTGKPGTYLGSRSYPSREECAREAEAMMALSANSGSLTFDAVVDYRSEEDGTFIFSNERVVLLFALKRKKAAEKEGAEG